jgi:hypothetical protein
MFAYERECTANYSHPFDLYNKYIILLDKKDKKALFNPIDNKITLKKIIRTTKEQNRDGEEVKLIKKKRERDLLVVPKSIPVEDIEKRNAYLEEAGYDLKYVENVFEPEMSRIEKLLIENEQNINNENEEEQEEDLFGLSEDEGNDDDENKDEE